MKRTFDWFKMYYRDYLGGTRRMTLEQRGAYSDLLMLIYDNNGPLPDDDRWISCQLMVDIRLWKRLRRELVALGKISVTAEGISNGRAGSELSLRQKEDKAVAKAIANPVATQVAKGSSLEKTQQKLRAKKDSRYKIKEITPVVPLEGDASQVDLEEVIAATPAGVTNDQILAAWNEVAVPAGAQAAKFINPAIAKKLNARVKEVGGFDKFVEILGTIPDSPFLTGKVKARDGGHPFRASLTWIAGPENFAKVVNGNYVDEKVQAANRPRKPVEVYSDWE